MADAVLSDDDVGLGAPAPAAAPSGPLSDSDVGLSGAPEPSVGSLIESPAVGFNRGLANTLGAPADAFNWARGKLGLGHSDNPLGGSQMIEQGMGLIGANPEEHLPQTTPERIGQGLGEGAAAVVAPEAVAGALAPEIAAVAPKVAEGAEALFGSAKSVPGVLGNAAVGAASGAASSSVDELPVSDNWKAVLRQGAGLLGGVVGAGAVEGVKGAAKAAEGVGNYLEPAVGSKSLVPGTNISATPGQQNIAARTLAQSAGGKGALEDAIGQGSGEIVPGATPTLAEQVAIPGVSKLQHDVETSDIVPFQERREVQNSARVGALQDIQPQGAPETVAQTFRDRLDALDQQSAGLVGQQQQAAQNEASAIGGQGTAEDAGAGIRTAAEDAKAQAHAARQAAYAAVPGDLNVVASPLRDAMQQISGRINEMATPATGEESQIYRAVSDMPNVVPFANLQALDSRITAAMSAERRSAGETPVLQRLTQMKSATMDAIQNAVQNQVAYERERVAAGAMQPEQTIEAQMNGTTGGGSFPGDYQGARGEPVQRPEAAPTAPPATRNPQSLLGFLRQVGGVQDQGGNLVARDTHTRFPGLVNNRTGVPLDRAREAAAEAGYLGPDTQRAIGNTTVNDLLDAIDRHPVYSVHDTNALFDNEERQSWMADQEKYRNAGQEIQSNLRDMKMPALDDPELLHDASRHMVDNGLDWDSALERASIEAENNRSDDLYHAAQSNSAPQGTTSPRGAGAFRERVGKAPPSESGEAAANARGAGASERVPNFTPEAADALTAAKQNHAQYAQTFKQGPVAQTLKGPFKGQYNLPASSVPAKFFPAGSGGAEGVRALVRAVGNDTAQPLLHDYAAQTLRREALRGDGTIDPNAYARWQKKYASALGEVPSADFGSAAQASERLARATELRKQALDTFQAGAIGRVMKLSNPEDVTREIGSVFGQRDSVTQMTRIANAARGNPAAEAGLRKAVVDNIFRRFVGNTDQIKPDMFQNFVRQNRPALGVVFKPEEIATMQAVADDLARQRVAGDQGRLPRQSTTAPDLLAARRREEAKGGHESLLGKLWKAAIIGGEANPVAGGVVGLGSIGTHFLGKMRQAGLAKAEDLVKEALLNRTGDGSLARELLKNYTEKTAKPISTTFGQQMRRLALLIGAGRASSPVPSDQPARADGGRVQVNENPTERQKAHGNYLKHHMRVHGLDVTIENPRGSYREGKGRDGKKWRCKLPSHYGYIRGTVGSDGDHVDCFIGPDENSDRVFVINQKEEGTRKFDEHKCMLGFKTREAAVANYKNAFSDGKGAERIMSVIPMSMEAFKRWLKDGDTLAPVQSAA